MDASEMSAVTAVAIGTGASRWRRMARLSACVLVPWKEQEARLSGGQVNRTAVRNFLRNPPDMEAPFPNEPDDITPSERCMLWSERFGTSLRTVRNYALDDYAWKQITFNTSQMAVLISMGSISAGIIGLSLFTGPSYQLFVAFFSDLVVGYATVVFLEELRIALMKRVSNVDAIKKLWEMRWHWELMCAARRLRSNNPGKVPIQLIMVSNLYGLLGNSERLDALSPADKVEGIRLCARIQRICKAQAVVGIRLDGDTMELLDRMACLLEPDKRVRDGHACQDSVPTELSVI